MLFITTNYNNFSNQFLCKLQIVIPIKLFNAGIAIVFQTTVVKRIPRKLHSIKIASHYNYIPKKHSTSTKLDQPISFIPSKRSLFSTKILNLRFLCLAEIVSIFSAICWSTMMQSEFDFHNRLSISVSVSWLVPGNKIVPVRKEEMFKIHHS